MEDLEDLTELHTVMWLQSLVESCILVKPATSTFIRVALWNERNDPEDADRKTWYFVNSFFVRWVEM